MEALDYKHPTHRFSVEQLHRMIEAGVFAPEDRTELIEGELLDMTPIGPAHCGLTTTLIMELARSVGDRALVSSQTALDLGPDTEVYPDLLVLKPRKDNYQRSNPSPDDTHLVIEIAHTSLGYDLNRKRPLYAAAAVPHVAIIDVAGRRIIDCRSPDRKQSQYREQQTIRSGKWPLAVAGIEIDIALDELFLI